MAVQVSYYNECLAAWEPLLEPVIVEDEKSMWKVQVKVCHGIHLSGMSRLPSALCKILENVISDDRGKQSVRSYF